MRSFFILVILLLINVSLAAKDLAGVNIPESVQLSGYEKPLLLNGAGIRKKLFMNIYLAALYLPERQSSPAKVLDPDVPKQLSMHFLYSKVSKSKMDDGWQSGFEDNSTKQEMSALQSRLDKFKTLFGDMREGDVAVLDFLPESGTRVSINGKESGSIEGKDFARVLLAIWLGEEPVTGSLKQDLLGLD